MTEIIYKLLYDKIFIITYEDQPAWLVDQFDSTWGYSKKEWNQAVYEYYTAEGFFKMHHKHIKENMRKLYIDIETTGLDPIEHEIIEIAIIEESHGIIERWSTKIKPRHIQKAHPKALKVNGYSEEAWSRAPEMSAVIRMIVSKIDSKLRGPCVIIGHNPNFDLSFIKITLAAHGKYIPRLRSIDTMTLAHEHLAPIGLKSLSMDSIRSFLNISSEGAHSALKDTEDVMKVYTLLCRATVLDRMIWKYKAILRNWIKSIKNRYLEKVDHENG
tara:strand:+ start:2342 stop:3157 length:816 start_codon:yes stop_codon:yes gene_type:complete